MALFPTSYDDFYVFRNILTPVIKYPPSKILEVRALVSRREVTVAQKCLSKDCSLGCPLSKTVDPISLRSSLRERQRFQSGRSKFLIFGKFSNFAGLYLENGALWRKSALSEEIKLKCPLSNETTSSPVALLEKVDTRLEKLKTPFLAIFGPIWGILTLILRADPWQVGVSEQDLIEFYHHAKFQLDPSTQ